VERMWFRSIAPKIKDSDQTLSPIRSEIAPRVYDSPVLVGSDWVNGLIVSENCRATRESMHIFVGAVTQIERYIVLAFCFRDWRTGN
jgi:hypothetical protein